MLISTRYSLPLGSNPTPIPSVRDAIIPQIQRSQVLASGPIASGSNSRHHDTVTAELPLPNEGCSDDQTRMQPGVNYEDTNREVPSDMYRQLSVVRTSPSPSILASPPNSRIYSALPSRHLPLPPQECHRRRTIPTRRPLRTDLPVPSCCGATIHSDTPTR